MPGHPSDLTVVEFEAGPSYLRCLTFPCKATAVDLSTGASGEAVIEMAGYVALVHKDEGTSYGVSFPDVPGCISAGDTLDDALANAAEALAGHLALMRADGEAEPKARSLEAIRADAELADDLEGAIVRKVSPAADVETRPIPARRGPSGPPKLLAVTPPACV
jgi:predicted RNase H-like HicB family nuclease